MPDEHLHQSEQSDDTTIVAAKTASEQPRENPAGDAEAGPDAAVEVLTLVCQTCGKDYHFTDAPPPPEMSCAKCGGTVFRRFESAVGDEVIDDFRDSTERDLAPHDAEGDVLPGDVIDLNNL